MDPRGYTIVVVLSAAVLTPLVLTAAVLIATAYFDPLGRTILRHCSQLWTPRFARISTP